MQLFFSFIILTGTKNSPSATQSVCEDRKPAGAIKPYTPAGRIVQHRTTRPAVGSA